MMGMKAWMLATAGAVFLANPAAAQVAANAPPASNDTSLQVDDIIATAQKREQSLQDVPISINAFNADAIASSSAETIGDLDMLTPGLTINDTSLTQPSYAIRGVRTDDFGIETEPLAGSFIDGVFSGQAGSSLIFFNDMARVEVLKGPQGTFFGRNTSAGAISIITRKPNATPEMMAIVRLGNCANRSITENLFLRINGVTDSNKGYRTGRGREPKDNSSGCAALRLEPTSATDIPLAYDHDDTATDGPSRLLRGCGYRTGENADWQDTRAGAAAEARAYLDINCSHCHAEYGPARTSGLWLDTKTLDARLLGICQPPVAAGRGTGNRPFDVVPGQPEYSIMSYRMASIDPGEMMPEFGRARAYKEGVALVERYIRAMKGDCAGDDGLSEMAAH